MVQAGLGLAVAYLCGALPWALWLGRAFAGVDVRERGSGNLGATNVYRVLGPRLGVAVLLLDMAKGVAGVLACAAIAGPAFAGGRAGAALGGALAAVLGHVFTVFAGFRGGKGVATAAGSMLAVAPVAGALGLATFALVLALSRRVSVGSVVAALVFAAALWLLPTAAGGGGRATAIVGSLVAVLLILRHLPNLRRLARGEEPPFTFRSGDGGGEAR